MAASITGMASLMESYSLISASLRGEYPRMYSKPAGEGLPEVTESSRFCFPILSINPTCFSPFRFFAASGHGHGEKSAYIASAYIRLTREEAFAIRYHMGFSGTEDPGNVGRALEMFPLAYALVCADMEAAFLMEGKLSAENRG